MALRVCPQCEKAFYVLSEKNMTPCHHCGYIANKAKENTSQDQRTRPRIPVNIDFTFPIGSVMKKVKMTDYSEGGARIVYRGEPLPLDVSLPVEVDDLDIHREADSVWTMKLSIALNSTGLRFKN